MINEVGKNDWNLFGIGIFETYCWACCLTGISVDAGIDARFGVILTAGFGIAVCSLFFLFENGLDILN